MNIKGFRIKNQKIQKLWISVSIALLVAIILIFTAFFIVFSKSSEFKLDKEDLFNFTSYYTKYNVVTYSNKNQNTYFMEEYCMRNNNETKFRFNTINENNNYSYIITNNTFHIKSENQINDFKGNITLDSNTNILSLATFIDIYSKIDNVINDNTFSNNDVEISVEEKDKKISYIVNFKEKGNNLSELREYNEIFIDGMKISKLELILDVDTKRPLEYIVYLQDGKAYVDIIYTECKINTKFDEKVFSF